MSMYYFKKYPFNYPFNEDDGTPMLMCTLPMYALREMYAQRIGRAPKSFFDCGAAIGYMVAWADKIGMHARGIDIHRYNPKHELANITEPYFARGDIKIGSILDAAPVNADLAYCNGTLTYMNEITLPLALAKFRNVGMLIAIHNTNEDIAAAAAMGAPITHSEPRLIRPNDWWMDTFRKNGFDVDFDSKYRCFCAQPKHQALGCGGAWPSQFVAHAR